MKKLNNKGFTLVELLAVIIILAIVVGISIPSITNIINGSKDSALSVAVESAVDSLQDQYDIYNIDPAAASTLISEVMAKGSTGLSLKSSTAADKPKIEALGFKTTNVEEVLVKVVDNAATQTATFCVEVKKIPKTSEYFITSKWTLNGTSASPKTGASAPRNKAGC